MMLIRHWLHSLRSALAPVRKHRVPTRWSLESLEDRRLMSFTPTVNYDVRAEPGATPAPVAILAADFNNDGDLDLVTANSGSNNVSVLLGSGNGVFDPPIDSPAGYSPKSISVGDFDGDGNLDLAAVNGYGWGWFAANPVVSVMFGNGNGSFQAPSEIVLDELSTPMSVAVGDFNEDRLMDIAVATTDDYAYPGDVYYGIARVNVILSHADRTFDPPRVVFENDPVGYYGYGVISPVVVTDFDGDNHQDVLVGFDWSGSGEVVRVLLGDGNGNLDSASNTNWNIRQGSGMAVGKLDGDDVADLVAADYGNVNVRLGNGAGGFEPPPWGQSYGVDGQIRAIALADFDLDEALDVVTANYLSNDIGILRGRGDGSFTLPEHFAADPGTYAVAAADFNGDGWIDVATANATEGTVSVLLNDQSWESAPTYASISISDASVTEGKRGIKYLEFTVSLAAAYSATVTVQYATQDGTATAWFDYVPASGTLTFAAGETTQTVRVAIHGDSTIESDESFQLLLSNPSGNAVISDPLGVGLILNDDLPRGRGKKK